MFTRGKLKKMTHLSIKADDFPLSETYVIFCCQTSYTPKLQRDHLVVGVIDAQACAPRGRGRWRWGNCDGRDPTWPLVIKDGVAAVAS